MPDLVTLGQVQAFVQDSTASSSDWVQACLDSASQAVIDWLGCDPISQTRTEIVSGSNTNTLIPRASGKTAPITGVTSISINPALCAPGFSNCWWGFGAGLPTPFSVDMAAVQFTKGEIFMSNGQRFPRGKKNVTLAFTSGYALEPTEGVPDMPSSIIQAVLYTAKAFFTALGKEMNATSESYSGVMSQGFAANGPGAVPPAAQMLLNPYKLKWFSPE